MKTTHSKLSVTALILFTIFSCKKAETSGDYAESISAEYSSADSISYAASQQIPERQFVKTAQVDMEVKDVYDATLYIERQLKDLGGFIVESRLNNQFVSEKTYETSDQEAVLVRKFQAENTMQVRVPSEEMGDFLVNINKQGVFLNHRIILAKDVTHNAKIAQLEKQKLEKTAEVIGKMKNNDEKAKLTENNLERNNQQQIANITLADDLKYSAIEIYLREPKAREVAITLDNSKVAKTHQYNFLYETKKAFLSGFYWIQKILVAAFTVWPLWLILGLSILFVKRNKLMIRKSKNENVDTSSND